MFGQGCVDHGQIAQTGTCCPGLTAWSYDANTGVAYDGFGCWNATYADVGQWSGPGGSDSGRCKPGLVAVNGRCAVYIPPGGGPPTPTNPPGGGGFFDNIDSTTLMMIGGGLLLLMMMGGKKK